MGTYIDSERSPVSVINEQYMHKARGLANKRTVEPYKTVFGI